MKRPFVREEPQVTSDTSAEQNLQPPQRSVKFGALRFDANAAQPKAAAAKNRTSSSSRPQSIRRARPAVSLFKKKAPTYAKASADKPASRHVETVRQASLSGRQTHVEPIRHVEPIHREAVHERIEQAEHDVAVRRKDPRFQHELKDLREQEDLREVDDDVEDVATLYEWYAKEHTHRPKSATWFAILAASITVISVGFLLTGNFIAALTIALAGGLTYYTAQREPVTMRYRIMTEGLAFNDLLYHYRDINSFNIIYEPGETKVVLIRSKKPFSPLLHMEIGDADPVDIRDVLLEFAREDLDLEEPIADVWARRLGF